MSDPTPIPIPESDEALLAECRIETFRAGGPGGQHQNRTESGVRLVHLPTDIRVTVREERSQHRNRALALSRLRIRLATLNERDEPRIETRIPPSQKRKRREAKKRRSNTKRMRKPPGLDE
ncbi:MAG: peptide chain release factor family protein [Longimicrobiales bacterium]